MRLFIRYEVGVSFLGQKTRRLPSTLSLKLLRGRAKKVIR